MFTIRSKSDLSLAYSLLRLYMEQGTPVGNAHAIEEAKKEIRKYTHKPSSTRRIIHDDGIDGYTALIEFPNDLEDEESAEEYFLANEYCECLPSAYDCTGQAFTRWHKLVKRRNRWYCYHCVRFDV